MDENGQWVKFNGKEVRKGETYVSNGTYPGIPRGEKITVELLDPGSSNALGTGTGNSGFVFGSSENYKSFQGFPWHFEGFEDTKREPTLGSEVVTQKHHPKFLPQSEI